MKNCVNSSNSKGNVNVNIKIDKKNEKVFDPLNKIINKENSLNKNEAKINNLKYDKIPKDKSVSDDSNRADINLYLDFFEFYNQNEFEECLKLLNKSKIQLISTSI